MLKKALLLLPCLFTIVLAGWYPEEQITNNKKVGYDLRWGNGHKVVVAANGVRHLVWHNTLGVYYKRYYPGSGWTTDYKVSGGFFPSIALDSNGTDIHVVWEAYAKRPTNGKHIFYQKCIPSSSGNGGWVGAPQDLTPDWPEHFNVYPSVACYQNHIVVSGMGWSNWGPEDTVMFCECVNGNWGSTVYFQQPNGTTWWTSIAVDPQSRYADVFISNMVMESGVFVKRRTGGTWQDWEAATAAGYECSIEVDPVTGYPHIVVGSPNTQILHTYWDPSLGWRPVEAISDPSALSCRTPSMFFSGATAFVIWAETDSDNIAGIKYSAGNYGNWTTPAWITSGHSDVNPSVTTRSNGDVYVVWQRGQGWGRLYTPDGERAQATDEGSLGNKVKADLLNLTIAPNPAIDLATVRYSVPVVGPVTLKLYDVIGREITTLAQGTHEPGSYHINLDTHTLAQGIYYLKYESGNYHAIKKLIIQR